MVTRADDRRARFRALHERGALFLMPNPWDVGSARLLAAAGFPALATTSAGLAFSQGRLDQTVSRDELVDHVAALAAATPLPLNVDGEHCYPGDPGGVTQTVRLLAATGAAGLSIEDYDPVRDRIEDVAVAAERVAEAAAAAHGPATPLVLTARAENHFHGIDDLDDTITRLVAYQDAGADVVYAPWLPDIDAIRRVVEAVRVPVNVLATPGGPTVAELGDAGVRRVSTGGLLARAAYGALTTAAAELSTSGTSGYASGILSAAELAAAFAPEAADAGSSTLD